MCQGDFTSAVFHHRPKAVLIVDGEFRQTLSVWHKEILHGLGQGIRVLGASSMGALRAAELERFGMEGVGEVFAYYRDGWLTSDADVALVHGTEDDGYPALTWPMVNVRATAAALAADGALGAGEEQTVLAAAEALHFTERTPRNLTRALVDVQVPADRAAVLADLVTQRYVDQKAADARAAFERLAVLDALDPLPGPVGEAPRHRAGRGFEALQYADATVHRRTGQLRGFQLVDDVALHDPDFDGLLQRALDRRLAVQVALDHEIEAGEDELALGRVLLLRRHGVDPDDVAAVEAWMTDNDLDEQRLGDLVHQVVLGDRVRSWLLDGNMLERNRRLVVEQLQLEGRYPRAADAAARRRAWADSRPTPPFPLTLEAIGELVARHRARTGWFPVGDIRAFADTRGFDALPGMLVALSDAEVAYDEGQRRRARVAGLFSGSRPSPPTGAGARVHALLETHQVTQVLLAAVELGVLDALTDGPCASDELAATIGADPSRLARLLAGLRALGLVRRDGSAWELTADGRLLVADEQGGPSLAAYAEHLRDALLPAWQGLADVVRGTDPPSYPSSREADLHIAAATEAIGLVDAVADAVEIPSDATVAELGGGLGGLTVALAGRHPSVRWVVVELPGTAERAYDVLRGRGLEDRVEVTRYAEDLVLPVPVAVCLVARVLVTLDDDAAVALLRQARAWLAPGGRIELVEPEYDATLPSALHDLVNLARSGGAVRTADAWGALAARAGLRVTARRRLVTLFTRYTLVPDPAGSGGVS